MIKVFIIEDDPMVRDINGKFLKKVEGFSLWGETGSVEEARKMIKENQPELILLDIYLPRGSGLDFLKWLRKEGHETDVILITADKSTESLEEALRYGAVDYLVKPFKFQRFKEALLQYKARRRELGKSEEIEQGMIDKLLGARTEMMNREKEDFEFEKGLNSKTYKRIWEEIEREEGCFSAESIAEKLGMARVTVRRYLEFMQEEGRLGMEMWYGKVGRPQHRYIRL